MTPAAASPPPTPVLASAETAVTLARDPTLAPDAGTSHLLALAAGRAAIGVELIAATDGDPLDAAARFGDRLDAGVARRPDGVALLTWLGSPEHPDDRPVAVVVEVDASVHVVVAAGHGRPALRLDRAPTPDDAEEARLGWRLAVHLAAAQGAGALLPPPPADPHPATYLATAWLLDRTAAAKTDPAVLDGLVLPPWERLLGELDLTPVPVDEVGLVWRAVHELLVARALPARRAARLGVPGTAWDANALIGDPAVALAAIAAAGRAAEANGILTALLDRGWARTPGGPGRSRSGPSHRP